MIVVVPAFAPIELEVHLPKNTMGLKIWWCFFHKVGPEPIDLKWSEMGPLLQWLKIRKWGFTGDLSPPQVELCHPTYNLWLEAHLVPDQAELRPEFP